MERFAIIIAAAVLLMWPLLIFLLFAKYSAIE